MYEHVFHALAASPLTVTVTNPVPLEKSARLRVYTYAGVQNSFQHNKPLQQNDVMLLLIGCLERHLNRSSSMRIAPTSVYSRRSAHVSMGLTFVLLGTRELPPAGQRCRLLRLHSVHHAGTYDAPNTTPRVLQTRKCIRSCSETKLSKFCNGHGIIRAMRQDPGPDGHFKKQACLPDLVKRRQCSVTSCIERNYAIACKRTLANAAPWVPTADAWVSLERATGKRASTLNRGAEHWQTLSVAVCQSANPRISWPAQGVLT
jgi:hypothetical protein